ncbi:MAG: ATPase [Fluviicola sp.]|nr:MAG: ATPase [Fluviicola sp.]
MSISIKLLTLLLMVISNFGISQEVLINNSIERVSIGKKIFVYQDNSGELTINEVKKINGFKPSTEEVPNFGISRGNVWIKIEITNKTDGSYFLEVAQPTLDEVAFYDVANDYISIEGDQFNFDERDIPLNHFVFDLRIGKNETKTYYLKVNSSNQVQIPLYIGTYDKIDEVNQQLIVFLSIFLGLMIAMILYNAVIYVFVKDNSYLYYVLYITILMFTQLTPHGYTFQFFWPDSTVFTQYSMFLFPITVGVTGVLFFNSFLKTKEYAPRLIWIFRLYFLFYAISVVLVMINEFKGAYTLIDITAMLVALTMLIGAFIILRRGNKTAIYFLLAWSMFLVGIVFWVLKDTGVLPHNNLTNYTMLLGSGLETILLSIGLANRINTYRAEKDKSRSNEIKALRENKRLISEQNIILEQKVKERTNELLKVNEELEAALNSVMEAQSKLLESEKMASLGQLTAGIAHEINNPINFVSSNIEPLKRDLKDIENLLILYASLDESNFKQKIKEIEAFKEEIELPYLKNELNEIITNIEEGARRTGDIVKGLKTFSRDDHKSKVPSDINKGIESSLTLVQNKLGSIQVETDLKEIPQILCYPGKLNQVFMNIIINAIDAIKLKYENGEGGKLLISSYHEESNQSIVISFKDNGVGIPQNLVNKIYDPFFTTKDVGKGTGLGLSIVYKIIDNHKGQIILDTDEQVGTNFKFILPVVS